MSFWGSKANKQEDAWKDGQSMHDPAMDNAKMSSGSGASASAVQQRNQNPYALPSHMDDDSKIIV